MGIFRYFYWHFKNYPGSIVPVQNEQRVPGFDIFALDLNAIFHPVCQKYFFQSSHPKKTFEGCYQEICKEIDRIVSHIPPVEELILSIDGVAGISKVNQQRQRRYRSVKEKDPQMREVFDTNQISVGTEFMYGLRQYIIKHYSSREGIVFLLDDIVGEGEHKIVRYLAGKQKKKMCIYSPDADLIMLGIALNKKNVFIFRPNIYSDIDCAYFLVSIDKFKKDVVKMVDSSQDPTQIVNDFVFMLFFLGNDFLPHSPSYEIKYGGIDMILSMYQKVLGGAQGLISVETGGYSVDVSLLRQVMGELAAKEVEMIRLKYKNFRGFPNPLLDKYINGLEENFSEYRREYYKKYFTEPVETIARDYLDGLCFVGMYYYNGMPDWQYQYPYDHAPFFTDLYEYLLTVKEDRWFVEFLDNPPLSPLEQLMCVLPHESKMYLPRCIQSFYDEKSELEDLYPREFEIDRDGVEQEYEALVKLPRIEPERIRRAFEKVKYLLNKQERDRNMTR